MCFAIEDEIYDIHVNEVGELSLHLLNPVQVDDCLEDEQPHDPKPMEVGGAEDGDRDLIRH